MKIAVVNGTEKKGVTYRLKEVFLAPFKGKAEIVEFYLPGDCPAFCCGCTNCIMKGEAYCKDLKFIQRIERELLQADLLVFTSPAYVFHASGGMKAFLDHMAYRWMPHRPAGEMFSKRAAIITQCLGAGGKRAAKDIRDSLSWWGVSGIKIFTVRLMGDVVWDNLSGKKRKSLILQMSGFSKKFFSADYAVPARTNLVTKVKFFFCRILQKNLHRTNPEYLDGRYWAAQGWLGKERPWKRTKAERDKK